MPLLTHSDCIKQYWEEVKDKYEGLTFEEFDKACRSPFNFAKLVIKNKAKHFIIFTFLGKFRTYPWIVEKQMKQYVKGLEKGNMLPEEFDLKTAEAQRYLKEVNKYYEKNPKELAEGVEGGT